MFLDIHNRFPRGEPLQPAPIPRKKHLSRGQEKVLLTVILFYFLVTFIAPVGGASLIQALIH